MIWTKQPIKKEIDELQRKFDKNLGTFTSLTDFNAALDTLGTSMVNRSTQNIACHFSTASSPFKVLVYIGTITKTQSDRYQVALNETATNRVIHGTKSANGWIWDELVLDSKFKIKQIVIPATVTHNIDSVSALNSVLEDSSMNTLVINSADRSSLVSAGLIPAEFAGSWSVRKLSSGYMFMEYTTYNGHSYFATINNGTLSEWHEVAQNSDLFYYIGDTYTFNGAQVPFRTMNDKSAILFRFKLPKACASNVNSFSIQITENSPTWFTGSDALGSVLIGASAGSILLTGKQTVQFTLPTKNTISEGGFGICELNATITFSA